MYEHSAISGKRANLGASRSFRDRTIISALLGPCKSLDAARRRLAGILLRKCLFNSKCAAAPRNRGYFATISNGLKVAEGVIFVAALLSVADYALGQQPSLALGSTPERISAELRDLKAQIADIQCSGTFTTKTFSEGWEICSSGRFTAVNSQRRLLTKSELDDFRFGGAPPDYLREVAMRCSTLRRETDNQLSRALFGFRRASPAVKLDVRKPLLNVPFSNWNHFQIDHGHIVPAFVGEENDAIFAALLLPEVAVRLLEHADQTSESLLASSRTLAKDHQHHVEFSWLMQTENGIIEPQSPLSPAAAQGRWELKLQSVHPDTKFVRLECLSRWSQDSSNRWVPLQLKTTFHHSSSWNWEVSLVFDQTRIPSDIAGNQFDVASMMFEPVTLTEADSPQVKKTYELLKQLYGIHNR